MSLQFQLRLKAGNHDRSYCPVSFRLPRTSPPLQGAALGAVAMREEGGEAVPVQVLEDNGDYVLHWIVRELAANEILTYAVTAEASVAADGAKGSRAADIAEASAAPHFAEESVAPQFAEASGADARGVRLVEKEHKLDIVIDGQYFTSYVFDPSLAKPYLGPIIGPYGDSYTRLDFETREHPHHRSLWLGIGDVNGIDAWNEPAERYGRQIVGAIVGKTAGPVLAQIESRQTWTAFSGKPQLEESRIATFYRTPADARLIDLEFTFTAAYGRVEFGATKEAGPLGIRVAESMKADNGGTIVNSYGSVGEAECWGRRAEWCDYCGDVGGHLLGIAAFDHPDNTDYPTYWHIRNYGLMAPNNLYFLGGKLLQQGQSVRYRYRIYFHEGNTARAKVAERYQDYIHPPSIELVRG